MRKRTLAMTLVAGASLGALLVATWAPSRMSLGHAEPTRTHREARPATHASSVPLKTPTPTPTKATMVGFASEAQARALDLGSRASHRAARRAAFTSLVLEWQRNNGINADDMQRVMRALYDAQVNYLAQVAVHEAEVMDLVRRDVPIDSPEQDVERQAYIDLGHTTERDLTANVAAIVGAGAAVDLAEALHMAEVTEYFDARPLVEE